MNTLFRLVFCCTAALCCLPTGMCGFSSPPSDSLYLFFPWIKQTETEFQNWQHNYHQQLAGPHLRLEQINNTLLQPQAQIPEYGYPLLLEKSRLETQIRCYEAETDLKLLRLRYRKSIELLKILYEKILSMDHHFTSLRTSQQILRISNPHEYPEFKEMKTILEERIKKKSGFALPSIMESNPYLSAMYSIVGLALGANDSRQDKAQLEKIACILDFTVRMHQDLNIIFYETEYLRDGNQNLKRECELLFADCARQVDYTIPLVVCRDSDDWEQLFTRLDTYIEQSLKAGNTSSLVQKKATANLQFAIDRVVHFLDNYCAFVTQGNEYYKKFAKIASGYSHEKICSEALPESFNRLKNDIEITLEKFNSAYKLPEIQGSRLKDLLYGIMD